MSFLPRMYSVDGTPEPSRSVLYAVLAGDLALTKKLLAAAPRGAAIGWHWEPYANLQRKGQLEALALVLDDPCFRFDAEFVCACCYFTPEGIRRLVIKHPRARVWVWNPAKFQADAIACYSTCGRRYNVGLRDRVIYAYADVVSAHKSLMRVQRWRLAFLLYPALRFWVQRRVEEMYAPGGTMAIKAGEHFAAAVAAGAAART